MGIDLMYRHVRHAIETIGTIQKAFKGEIVLQQHLVDNGIGSFYKVDLYIPEHNIVVGCDERDHAYYDMAAERERTRTIKTQLKDPPVVRYNPDKAGFDLFAVIGTIHQHVRASLVEKHQRPIPSTHSPPPPPLGFAFSKPAGYPLAILCEEVCMNKLPPRR